MPAVNGGQARAVAAKFTEERYGLALQINEVLVECASCKENAPGRAGRRAVDGTLDGLARLQQHVEVAVVGHSVAAAVLPARSSAVVDLGLCPGSIVAAHARAAQDRPRGGVIRHAAALARAARGVEGPVVSNDAIDQ